MAAASVGEAIDEIAQRATSATTTSGAAEAMAEALRAAIGERIGADLTMSRAGAGPVEVDPVGVEGSAEITVRGATWALADQGRRRPVKAYARRRSALSTPWGPRASARGSTWPGFGIAASAAESVLDAGVTAIHDAVFTEAG